MHTASHIYTFCQKCVIEPEQEVKTNKIILYQQNIAHEKQKTTKNWGTISHLKCP
jgi:hypothetical protein